MPVAKRHLLIQSVLVGDAGFAVVLLEVAAAGGSPSLLVEVDIPGTAKGRFGQTVVLVVLPVVGLFVVRIVVDRVLELTRNVVVGLIKEPNQPIDFVAGFPSETAYGLKGLFRGHRVFVVHRRLWRWRCWRARR